MPKQRLPAAIALLGGGLGALVLLHVNGIISEDVETTLGLIFVAIGIVLAGLAIYGS